MRNQTGFTLIEVLVSLAILGVFGVVLLGGLATVSKTTPLTDKKSTAQNLAESQMEYVQSLDYDYANNPPNYGLDPDIEVPGGYNIITVANRLDPEADGNDDDGIQKIEITVTQGNKTVITLESRRIR